VPDRLIKYHCLLYRLRSVTLYDSSKVEQCDAPASPEAVLYLMNAKAKHVMLHSEEAAIFSLRERPLISSSSI